MACCCRQPGMHCANVCCTLPGTWRVCAAVVGHLPAERAACLGLRTLLLLAGRASLHSTPNSPSLPAQDICKICFESYPVPDMCCARCKHYYCKVRRVAAICRDSLCFFCFQTFCFQTAHICCAAYYCCKVRRTLLFLRHWSILRQPLLQLLPTLRQL